MTDWKAGEGSGLDPIEGRGPDPVEAALEGANSPAAVRRTALMAAVVTFSLAALAAGYFGAGQAEPPVADLPAMRPPPMEKSTIIIDEVKSHALPYRKYEAGERAPQPRALIEVKPRESPLPKPVMRRAKIEPVIGKPRKPKKIPIPKPAFEDKLSKSKPNGGSFVGGAGAGLVYEGVTDAAILGARDPLAYAAQEQAAAMRALKAVLMGDDKDQQTIERTEPKIYKAEEAVQAVVEQNHGTTTKKKSGAGGVPAVIPSVNGLALPANMQAELERIGREYEKRKK